MTPATTFLYLHCGDLAVARSFYGDLLGLDEIYVSAETGVVGYRVGTLQITIAVHDAAVLIDGWSAQLGWGGETAAPSWGFELDAVHFGRVVERVGETGIESRHPAPRWVGYWSFPVRDPMGNTVEISCPDASGWRGLGAQHGRVEQGG